LSKAAGLCGNFNGKNAAPSAASMHARRKWHSHLRAGSQTHPNRSFRSQLVKEPHRTRSIGAVYSETSDYFNDIAPQANFDAILFVNHTTASTTEHRRCGDLPD